MSSIKISNSGYVTTHKQLDLLRILEVQCVPTGKTRTRPNGEVEAQFLQISGHGTERYLWLQREDIW